MSSNADNHMGSESRKEYPMDKLNVVAIIPARGGSKGIPRKNIVPVAGKPLIAWSIEHALAARLVGEVVVSTDSEEIAAVARQYGARVVNRPPELATDQASSESALCDAIDQIERADGQPIDLVVFLQATSPVRGPVDIDGAIERLLDAGAESCFSACPQHFTGRWRELPDGGAKPMNFELGRRPRRQEYAVEYLENGSIYVFRPRLLRETGARLGGKIAIYPMGVLESIQIDSPEDLALTEEVLAIRQRRTAAQSGMSRLAGVGLLAMDFDGVMTDNCLFVDESGREMVRCHRGDGWGVARLRDAGIDMVVISTETNPVVAARCRKLSIPCIQNCRNKLAALKNFAEKRSLGPDQVAFMGNDVNDLECLHWAGIAIVPADACPEAISLANLTTTQCGGEGAVRQVADWILAVRRADNTKDEAP